MPTAEGGFMSGYIDRRHVKNKAKWSKPSYTVKVEKDIYVNMRNGKRILVDVYRPEVKDGKKFPALLAMAPLGKDAQETARWLPPQPFYTSPMCDVALEAGNPDYFVSRGYVFVMADPQGIGHSEGEYVGLLGSMGKDGYDVIEWMAKQPWCDGNIGMTGVCVFSAAQLLVAAEQPPHLKALIVPLLNRGLINWNIMTHQGSVVYQDAYRS